MLGYMHEATPYGYLVVNGASPTVEQIANLVGAKERLVVAALAELEQQGVFSRDADRRIFCRRMPRDMERAEKDRQNGRGGGNPTLKAWVNPQDKAHGKSLPEARSQKDKPKRAVSAALPDWLPLDAWERWKQHKGRKLTPAAATLQIKKLDAMRVDHDVTALIDLAIESSWATFYPPREQPQVNGKGKSTGGAWWASEAGALAKGREVGLNPRMGESMADFQGRIKAALDT